MLKELEKLNASAAESIDNSQPVTVPEAMSVGDMLPQGDIGLHMIAELPSAASRIGEPWKGDFQLAPGNSKGSRHMIPQRFEGVVKIYRVSDGDPLSDLAIEADGKFDLTHPEHADHIGYPPGVYRVRHQQNAQRERVLD